DDGLNDHQCGEALQEMPVKKDSTLNILTVMSDRVTVKFKCHICRYIIFMECIGGYITYCVAGRDEQFMRLNGKQKVLHKGGNSSCRFHIHQHYNAYKKKCNDTSIPVNHWAIPWPIWNAMEEAKEEAKRG
ncbi:hypothetical protein BYT27DRAFT_7020127, partial [Phlegmacium glaucopus]